ncbi:MAG: hypothetical protein JSW65_08615 [Candidatus Bipolaricaulota bacterium]|nr:MAG: hypothetical protein JSW65_08615 [Candidatus Bipolaricaulota bacterium]
MALALALAEMTEIPADSAIYRAGEGIERVLLGIDLKSAELLAATHLGYDCAISHHPVGGSATLRFHEVLRRHVEQMVAAGVPQEVAAETVHGTAETRRVLASMTNYDHDPSVARLLGVPYMNIHTPLDEIGRRRMAAIAGGMEAEDTVGALVERLYETFGEFRNADTEIEVRVGAAANRLGRVAVSHAAGTNGGYPVAKAYFDHGIDTVVYIHCRPEDAAKLAADYGDVKNLVVTGHIASDSLGINPFVAALRDRGLIVDLFSGVIEP